MHLAGLHQPRDQRKPLNGGQGAIDVLVGELARLGDAAPQGAGGLFIVQRRQRARVALVDDEAHRV